MKIENIDILVSCMDHQAWPYTQNGNIITLNVMGDWTSYRVTFVYKNGFFKICSFFEKQLPKERFYEGFPFVLFMNKNLDFGSVSLEGGQLYFYWTLPKIQDLDFLLEEIIKTCDKFEPLWCMLVKQGNLNQEIMETFIKPIDGHA